MRTAANHETIRAYVWLNVYCHLMFLYLSQRRATPEVVAETEQTAELEAEIAELGKTIGDFTLNRDLASRIREMTSAISKAHRPVWAGMDPRHPNPARFATMIGKLSPTTNRAIEGYRMPKLNISSYGIPTYRNLFNGITPGTTPYSSIRRLVAAQGFDTSPTAPPKITVLGSRLANLATANTAARTDLSKVVSGILPSHHRPMFDSIKRLQANFSGVQVDSIKQNQADSMRQIQANLLKNMRLDLTQLDVTKQTQNILRDLHRFRGL